MCEQMNPSVIQLSDKYDKMLADIAQNAIVTGSTLPSGLKIRKQGVWIISEHAVKNKSCDSKLDSMGS